MNKLYFSFLLLLQFYSLNLISQNNKYAIQCSVEDALKIHDFSSGQEYMLPTFIRSGGGCLIECADPKLLILENISDVNIKLKVFNIETQKRTGEFWMMKESKEKMSSVWEKYEVGFIQESTSILNQIASFFSGSKTVIIGNDALLKSNRQEFIFNQKDSLIIAEIDDYYLSWKTEHTLEEISILEEGQEDAIWTDRNVRYQILHLNQLWSNNDERVELERGKAYVLVVKIKNSEGLPQLCKLHFNYLSKPEFQNLQSYLNALLEDSKIILNGNFKN